MKKRIHLTITMKASDYNRDRSRYKYLEKSPKYVSRNT